MFNRSFKITTAHFIKIRFSIVEKIIRLFILLTTLQKHDLTGCINEPQYVGDS